MLRFLPTECFGNVAMLVHGGLFLMTTAEPYPDLNKPPVLFINI